jgi:S1-C subfamily serine protease
MCLIFCAAVLLGAVGPYVGNVKYKYNIERTYTHLLPSIKGTALVVMPDGSGSAFCISKSGLFVTAAHVAQSGDGEAHEDGVHLVLYPGSDDELVLDAYVAHVSDKYDLAFVRPYSDQELPKEYDVAPLGPLEMGSVKLLRPVVAVGFPYGLTPRFDDDYPSVSLNTGHVTGSVNIDGVALVQIDADVWYGNSGGPIVDARSGRVVGILVRGFDHGEINFMEPVSHLWEFIRTSDLSYRKPRPIIEPSESE